MVTGISRVPLEELIVAGGDVSGGVIVVGDGDPGKSGRLSAPEGGCGEFTATRVPTGQTRELLAREWAWESAWASHFEAAA